MQTVKVELDEEGVGAGSLCLVHDADDVVPGRTCGRPMPCRDHGRSVRLMRGQCVVRELVSAQSSALWTPDIRTRDRDVKTHRGVVLGLGPPAFLDAGAARSPVVPWDCSVGDVVQYHYVHNHEAHTRPWTDGEDATWIPQMSVDAVIS